MNSPMGPGWFIFFRHPEPADLGGGGGKARHMLVMRGYNVIEQMTEDEAEELLIILSALEV